MLGFVLDNSTQSALNGTMEAQVRHLPLTLSIAAVERDTGLSKDTLRVWERRYGFPRPTRDAIGERAYPLDQVERLRVVKRLLDAGHRPGRVVALPHAALCQLADSTVGQPRQAVLAGLGAGELRHLVSLLRQHETEAVRRLLSLQLARLGVRGFVVDVIAPLNQAIGDAWMRGELEVFEEHLYSELVQAALRQALTAIPPPAGPDAPRVLLTTLPGEPHGLGLLMAEAILALEGCTCLSLGVQTPVLETAKAALALRADVVALGFAGSLGLKQVLDSLGELRAALPRNVQIWAGGNAPGLQRRPLDGVHLIDTLNQIPEALTDHRRGAAT